MPLVKAVRRGLKKMLFGGMTLPQRFFMGQEGPQTEVSVWIDGLGKPYDVTMRHSMACAVPFTVCVGFDRGHLPSEKQRGRLHLRFAERGGRERVLGDLALVYKESISVPGSELMLFEAKGAKNYCLPPLRLWAFYLHHAYVSWVKPVEADIKLSFMDKRALEVMFICPRAIALMSAMENGKGNMFPVNVMGEVAEEYFAFSLKDTRLPAHLVERTRRVALSNVPMEHGALAYSLGKNHVKEFIDWYELPFETRPSEHYEIPVPVFAFRVREMEVEVVHFVGSHTFFVARLVADEMIARGEELTVVHGHYQAWRLKTRASEAVQLLAEDARIKRGVC